jgi:phosphatidylserine decarboxylase
MVSDGIYYALAFSAGGAIVWYLARPAFGVPLFLLALFFLYFFRDPNRVIPSGEVAVSPADGKVVDIRAHGAECARISIFLNIFNVHVNRAPIGGKIVKVEYKKGQFLVASRAAASSENESNTVTIQGQSTTVQFAQIAGLLARRIVFTRKLGDRVEKGDRVGLIKFGSRVDVFLGPEWEITVQPGDHVAGGSSILARLRRSEDASRA